MKKLFILALLFCSTGIARAQLYMTTGDNGANGQLFTVNPSTAATNFVANLDVGGVATQPVSVIGMAYDSQNGVLYGVTRDNSNNTNFPTNPNVDPDSLVSINRTNGHVTFISSLGEAVASLAYDATTNTLYTWSQVDADDNSNQSGPIGNIIFSPPPPSLSVFGNPGNTLGGGDAGIAVDSTGTVYLVGPDTAASGFLWTVDGITTDGTMNFVSELSGFGVAGGGTVTGMTIVGGTLYAIDSDKVTPSSGSTLVTIENGPDTDPDSGIITSIGTLAPANAQALALVTAVPEPATYAGLLGLGSVAVALLRRRRVIS